MTWASIFGTVAILALAAGCAGRAAIPPGAPPEIALPRLAQEGDPDAQVSLGYMYETGQFFEQSYSQAARWYRPAAEQGNALAQFALGELYSRGLGLDRDYNAAAYWFRRAAMGGNMSAQFQLGYLYENGLGVTRDYGAAALWYSRASRGSRGLNASPPAIERLAGKAYGTSLLMPPPRLSPAGQAAPAQVSGERAARDEGMVLRKPEPPTADDAASPANGVWVHVASFRTRNAAANQWETLKKRHAVLLDGLTVDLVRVDLGGDKGVWVRVQVGPLADMTVAKSLCAALQAHDVYCAPVAP